MGNFFRRVFAFLLGMIFAVVLIVGGTAGFGYWAFKNLTLKDAGAEQEGIGELNNLTIEEWVALYNSAQKDPQAFTLKALEDYGFSTEDFLKSLGVDVNNADVEDINVLKQVAPLTLIEGGSENIPMALMFALMPKNEGGKYPIFSKHARDILRSKPLSIMTEIDEFSNRPIIYEYICDLGFGAILSQLYEENYDYTTASYVYTSTERRLNIFGNVKFAVITDTFLSGKEFNFGKEVNDGKLTDIGNMLAKEFLASIMSDSEENYNQLLSNLNVLQDTTVKGLFRFDEEKNSYEFDLEPVLTKLNVGAFLGYVKCTGDDNCKVDHIEGTSHDNKWYVENGEGVEDDLYKGEGISADIMHNLFELTLTTIMSGLEDINFLLDGIYLGKALGYHVSEIIPSTSDYCTFDCSKDEVDQTHEHKYYWVNDKNNYVGDMFNTLSNNTLVKLFTNGIKIDDIFSSANIGGLLGYTKCTGDDLTCNINHNAVNPCGSGVWFDTNGNLIDSSDLTGKIMGKLYDKKINELSTISVNELLSGNYLGDLMGFERGEKLGFCKSNCELDLENAEHKHNYYWLENSDYVGEVQNSLSNIDITKLLSGEKISITGVLGESKIGTLMDFNLIDGKWQKQNGESAIEDNNAGKILNRVLSKTVNELSSGSISDGLFDDMRFGDFLGYTYNSETEHWEKEGVYVGKLYNDISNLELKKAMTDGVDVEEIINELDLGEVFGYVYCDGVSPNCKIPGHESVCVKGWYDDEKLLEGDTVVNKIMLNIYSDKLKDIKDNKLSIAQISEGVYLGELLNYTKNELGEWEDKNKEKLSVVNETLANVYLTDLINGTTDISKIIGDLSVGEVMNYEYENGVWKKNGVEISKIESILANEKLSSILNGTFDIKGKIDKVYLKDVVDTSGNNKILNVLGDTVIEDLPTRVNSLTVGEVIDTESSDCSQILKLLKDKNVNNLGSEINVLKIGEICGYSFNQSDNLWYKNDVAVKGINQKIANYTLEYLSNNGLNSSEFTLKDVVNEDLSKGVFSVIYMGNEEGSGLEGKQSYSNREDIPINEISTRITYGFKNAKCGELIDGGILTLSSENQNKLTTIFMVEDSDNNGVNNTSAEAEAHWKGLKITQLLDAILSKIPG